MKRSMVIFLVMIVFMAISSVFATLDFDVGQAENAMMDDRPIEMTINKGSCQNIATDTDATVAYQVLFDDYIITSNGNVDAVINYVLFRVEDITRDMLKANARSGNFNDDQIIEDDVGSSNYGSLDYTIAGDGVVDVINPGLSVINDDIAYLALMMANSLSDRNANHDQDSDINANGVNDINTDANSDECDDNWNKMLRSDDYTYFALSENGFRQVMITATTETTFRQSSTDYTNTFSSATPTTFRVDADASV